MIRTDPVVGGDLLLSAVFLDRRTGTARIATFPSHFTPLIPRPPRQHASLPLPF